MKYSLSILAAIFVLSSPFGLAQSAQWTYSTNLGSGVEAFSVVGSGDAWVVLQLENGGVYRFDGVSWSLTTELYPGDNGRNYGIFALDSEHIWVSGHINAANSGRIYFGDGINWYLQTEIAGSNWWIYDVYAADANNVWASGPAGHIYYSSDGGANWSIQTTIDDNYWFSIDGLNAQNVWAAGNDTPARIAYYNGTGWSIETSFNTQSVSQYLRSISVASSDQIWAAVEDGTVLQRHPGGQWAVSTVLSEQGTNETGISVYNGKNVGLVMDGDASGIYFFNGSGWAVQTDIDLATALDISHGPRAWAGDAFGGLYFRDISGSPRYRNDFDGDGSSDIAIFRYSIGLWAIRGVSRFYFGGGGGIGDELVPADYDGDGTTDPAIYRQLTGLWAVRGVTRIYFGEADWPIPSDFDGDGTYGPSIFRAYSGLWAVRGLTRVYFGTDGDSAQPGYYSGGPAMDFGIVRENTGLWAVRGLTRFYFGGSSDFIKPGDYDGDGVWEGGIFRQANGLWAIRGITRRYFGGGDDGPVPAAYSGGPAVEIGIFRPSSGLWAVPGTTRVYFGRDGDIPLSR